ncbi:hypothetical protein TWF696_001141 [Orbilia brochopaga]|uniref:Probable glucan endo-1,3-beta-glucosidase eglC n=1 Tax=Orbilia brochopaga TaxID=3140254 RepID=A0AAV9VDJ3_9PEZI
MLGKSVVLAALAVASVSAENYLGFNYGASKASGPVKVYTDFKEEFDLARKLAGTQGRFNSARLYTNIQGPSKDDPISAFQAAIDTKTTLLLGIWCSAGQEIVTNEISALIKAINQYGTKFTDLVVGLSVGSEDLYRNSVMGIENKSGIGAQPSQIAEYINQVRKALASTPLKSVPIGHVDTWTAWVNGTNKAVIDAVDWIGSDAYPYFQSTMPNSIEDAPKLFWEAYNVTAAATGKEVWITETGWPVQGKDMNLAKAGAKDAQTYWNEIGCALFGNYKTWWYMLRDADPTPPETEFGVVDANLKPYYDLSCKNAKPVPSPVANSTPSSSSAASSGKPSPTGTNSSGNTPSKNGPSNSPGTYSVEPSSAPSGTGAAAAKPAQTTGAEGASGNASNSAVSSGVAMSLVAINAVAVAFFLL